MNKAQLETFIRLIKEGSGNPRLIHLCEAYEAFLALYASRNQEQSNPEAFEKKLSSSYRTMWDSFNAVAETLGIGSEQFLTQFMNPGQFTPEGMQSMNSLQESLEAIEGPAPARKNKQKSNKKNVRI